MPVINRVAHFGLQNFARCRADAAYPHFWDGLVFLASPHVNPPGGTKLWRWDGSSSFGTLTLTPSSAWTIHGGGRTITGDGTNNVDFGDVAAVDFGSGNFSFAFWILGGGNGKDILDKDNDFGTGNGVYVFTRLASGKYSYWNGSTQVDFGAQSASEFHLLGASRDGTGANQVRLYYDGADVGTITDARTLSNALTLTIFGHAGAAVSNGAFGDIAFWNATKPASFHRDLFLIGRGGIFTPRRMAWGAAQAAAFTPWHLFQTAG
jgi:hypothetical protein